MNGIIKLSSLSNYRILFFFFCLIPITLINYTEKETVTKLRNDYFLHQFMIIYSIAPAKLYIIQNHIDTIFFVL